MPKSPVISHQNTWLADIPLLTSAPRPPLPHSQIAIPDVWGLGPGILIMGGSTYNYYPLVPALISPFVEIFFPYKAGQKVYSYPIEQVTSPKILLGKYLLCNLRVLAHGNCSPG
jgi:hypothetical protein